MASLVNHFSFSATVFVFLLYQIVLLLSLVDPRVPGALCIQFLCLTIIPLPSAPGPSQEGSAYTYECVKPTTAENVHPLFQKIMHYVASHNPVLIHLPRKKFNLKKQCKYFLLHNCIVSLSVCCVIIIVVFPYLVQKIQQKLL